MSLFQQEVKKGIGPYMKAKGFRLRGRTYYYIKNDIAYCISFEQPTGLMYTWAHVNPLYIPHEFMVLSYGNRLNNMEDVKLPTLTKWCEPTDIDNWCELFFCCMDDYVLPAFQRIDAPEKLLAYVEQPEMRKADGVIRCPQMWIEKLRMFTYLYLRDFPKAEDALESYKNALSESRTMIATLREKLQQEADEIKLLISSGDEAVHDFCERTIANTKKLFVKSK